MILWNICNTVLPGQRSHTPESKSYTNMQVTLNKMHIYEGFLGNLTFPFFISEFLRTLWYLATAERGVADAYKCNIASTTYQMLQCNNH